MAKPLVATRTGEFTQALPKTMRAAQITQPQQVALIECNLLSPAANQALIKFEGCGVCGSNLPVWEEREWFLAICEELEVDDMVIKTSGVGVFDGLLEAAVLQIRRPDMIIAF
jgi:hypothetical protein